VRFVTRLASLAAQAGEGYRHSLLVGALSAGGASSLKTSGEGHVSREQFFLSWQFYQNYRRK